MAITVRKDISEGTFTTRGIADYKKTEAVRLMQVSNEDSTVTMTDQIAYDILYNEIISDAGGKKEHHLIPGLPFESLRISRRGLNKWRGVATYRYGTQQASANPTSGSQIASYSTAIEPMVVYAYANNANEYDQFGLPIGTVNTPAKNNIAFRPIETRTFRPVLRVTVKTTLGFNPVAQTELLNRKINLNAVSIGADTFDPFTLRHDGTTVSVLSFDGVTTTFNVTYSFTRARSGWWDQVPEFVVPPPQGGQATSPGEWQVRSVLSYQTAEFNGAFPFAT
jgi:hypothetical protein